MFNAQIAYGLLIPFLGTLLGSACVFFMKKQMGLMLERILEAFAAGVMVAASVWSLLIPSLEHAASKGTWAFVPAAVGFWAGILLLLLLDEVIPHLH
ncbi:MAG: ZIP family metal transporter, partial [Eubacteriales bacterium]